MLGILYSLFLSAVVLLWATQVLRYSKLTYPATTSQLALSPICPRVRIDEHAALLEEHAALLEESIRSQNIALSNMEGLLLNGKNVL